MNDHHQGFCTHLMPGGGRVCLSSLLPACQSRNFAHASERVVNFFAIHLNHLASITLTRSSIFCQVHYFCLISHLAAHQLPWPSRSRTTSNEGGGGLQVAPMTDIHLHFSHSSPNAKRAGPRQVPILRWAVTGIRGNDAPFYSPADVITV